VVAPEDPHNSLSLHNIISISTLTSHPLMTPTSHSTLPTTPLHLFNTLKPILLNFLLLTTKTNPCSIYLYIPLMTFPQHHHYQYHLPTIFFPSPKINFSTVFTIYHPHDLHGPSHLLLLLPMTTYPSYPPPFYNPSLNLTLCPPLLKNLSQTTSITTHRTQNQTSIIYSNPEISTLTPLTPKFSNQAQSLSPFS
jgi:hypothetical protein